MNRPLFPTQVIAVSDIVTLVEDMGNQIPHKSWMLYLLELFNKQNIAIELNLICQFDKQDYFEAIFQGINQYRFRQISPVVVGNSYLRQIIMNSQRQTISYILQDQSTRQTERFDLSVDRGFICEGLNHFTGIEWWNKISDFPYPIRYHVEVSQLVYGQLDDPNDSDSISYRPYNSLIPNKDGSSREYPILFHDARIKDSCICYNIVSGICDSGLKYNY